jgi:hypothetical protein
MNENDKLFLQLLYIFHSSAMQGLGKVINPLTKKSEKNMEQAKQSIAMLEMIKEKTVNNLNKDQCSALDSFLTELRMNYVDEVNKN